MRICNLMIIAAAVLVSAPYCRPQCDGVTNGKKSNLTIVPIDRSKSLSDQDDYIVKEFVDLRSSIDRSGLFGRHAKGHIDNYSYYASDVPFGRYRIKLQPRSGPGSFGRLIDVCQHDEKVEVPREFARVHIIPLLVDANSVSLDPPDSVQVSKFQNTLDDTDISDLFKQGVADQVPYGYYTLEVSLPLGYIKREVDVFQPDVWVFSGSPAFYGDADTSGPGNVIRGELKNIPANERPIFMTMSGIYFPYTINSVVSDTGNGSGSFSFIGKNPSGKFMLYTIGKSGILDAREFGIPRDSVITVDLSHRTPPTVDNAP